MGEDFVRREEYNDSIGRLHDQVKSINDSVIRNEVSVKHIEKFTEDIHKVLYGNGNDGFITCVNKKLTQLFERVSLHTKIIVGIGIMGTASALVAGFWKHIIK